MKLLIISYGSIYSIPVMRYTGSLPSSYGGGGRGDGGRVTTLTFVVRPGSIAEGHLQAIRLTFLMLSLVSKVICTLKGCCIFSPTKIKESVAYR